MLQEKAAAKACQQGACRLQNPCGGMEGKRHDTAQEYYIQAGRILSPRQTRFSRKLSMVLPRPFRILVSVPFR